MALIGSTITITMEYRSPDGKLLVDPVDLAFSVYDRHSRKLIHTQTLDASNRVSMGVYSVDYTIPDGNTKEIVVEMKGILDGKAVLNRKVVPRSWI